ERVPLLGGFNPMDPEHYPVVSAHLSVHGLNREIKFEQLLPDVDAQRIAPHRAGFLWARSIPAERRDSLFLAMQKPGTGARLFSPMLMVRPGEAGAIGPDSVDKEGLSTGGHRISAHARLEGEDIWLTIRHETRDEAGELVERG